ncbi:MAG: serine/threonine protein kinase [Rubripirellula sp.]|nr:serine/threonine protein kinase [Rhodopirellula sp.]MCH1440069.1 serine/threonine protein kinase [Rubripirellula sp.]
MQTFRQISEFELGDILGVGTVGTIYRAIEKSSRKPFAIKKLHPGVSQDQLIRARFRREMAILERLRHPHIVCYYGGGEDDGTLFYVMELVDGGTVKSLLKLKGAFEWPIVVEVTRQICSALQYAHNNGVIHRDLKPSNLFLTKSGEIKLGDFGIARDLDRSDITASGMTVGTHAYMAPEQITGDEAVSGKADLYSLGCCQFEMLVGRTPFQGDNFAQLFEQHLRTDAPHVRDFAASCPLELDSIVSRLLEKNPEDRPFNARQVQALMLQLDENFDADESKVGKQPDEDVGADDVVARGKELLRNEIRQAEVTHSDDVSWGRLVFLAALVLAMIAFASFLGR